MLVAAAMPITLAVAVVVDLRLRHGHAFEHVRLSVGDPDSLAFRSIACEQHPITTPWRISGAASGRNSLGSSCKCCKWRRRTNSSWHGGVRRHRAARQRELAQRAVLRARPEKIKSAAQGRSVQEMPCGRADRSTVPEGATRLGGDRAAEDRPGGYQLRPRLGDRSTRPRASMRASRPEAMKPLAKRVSWRSRHHKKPGGKPPARRQRPQPDEQINLSDDESRIMRSPAAADPATNAQGVVDNESMLVVASPCHPGRQRQGGRADGGEDPAGARGLNQPKTSGRYRFYSENPERRSLPYRQDRAAGSPSGAMATIRPALPFRGSGAAVRPASHVAQMKHALKTKAG